MKGRNLKWGAAAGAVLAAVILTQAAWADGKGDPKAGKAIFDSRCTVCHGANGAGDGPAGKALKPNPAANLTDAKFMASKTDAQLEGAIKKGLNAMPPSGSLSEKELKDIVAYIRTLKK